MPGSTSCGRDEVRIFSSNRVALERLTGTSSRNLTALKRSSVICRYFVP